MVKKWIIKYRDVGSDRIRSTSYTGYNTTKADVIKFFGLDNSDVEWYDVFEETPENIKTI